MIREGIMDDGQINAAKMNRQNLAFVTIDPVTKKYKFQTSLGKFFYFSDAYGKVLK